RLDAVKDKKKSRVLILLSDGEQNVSTEDDAPGEKLPGVHRTLTPREAAQMAAKLDVKVYTIDAGGAPPPGATPDAVAQREAGRRALKDVADMTGGKTFGAASGAELLAAYREISALEKSPARAPIFRRYRAFYPWAAGAALVLLLLAHALDRTVWRAAV
ncbi:MAG: vWA domain-containing protein, partial [Gemmata sp.]